MTVVAVVDYGAGNLGNARRAVTRLGFVERLARTSGDLEGADVILLPGVGAWGAAMTTLRARGLAAALCAAAAAGRPIVGICLGLQLLFERSEEAPDVSGLGILAGGVRRLRAGGRPLPHLGWAPVAGVPFYFAHSFCAEPADPAVVTGVAEWGEPFPAIVARGRVRGVQFHPERSGAPGLAWFGRFLAEAAA